MKEIKYSLRSLYRTRLYRAFAISNKNFGPLRVRYSERHCIHDISYLFRISFIDINHEMYFVYVKTPNKICLVHITVEFIYLETWSIIEITKVRNLLTRNSIYEGTGTCRSLCHFDPTNLLHKETHNGNALCEGVGIVKRESSYPQRTLS